MTVNLGMVELVGDLSLEQRMVIKTNLQNSGYRKSILKERIKNIIIEMFPYSDKLPKVDYSEFINGELVNLFVQSVQKKITGLTSLYKKLMDMGKLTLESL
jgi:hypothetical protein